MDPLNRFPTALHLKVDLWRQMLADVLQRAPQEEACGLLAGDIRQGVYRALQCFPVTNQLHSPYRYNMDPQELLNVFTQIDKQGHALVAIYHSHPKGPEGPSETDIAQAYYPDSVYLIWSHLEADWSCQGFLILQGRVYPVELALEE